MSIYAIQFMGILSNLVSLTPYRPIGSCIYISLYIIYIIMYGGQDVTIAMGNESGKMCHVVSFFLYILKTLLL